MIEQFERWTRAFDRVVEGSPILVVVALGFVFLVWRTWRSEREELLSQMRAERAEREAMWQTERANMLSKFLEDIQEERAARAVTQAQFQEVMERFTNTSLAVREALLELKIAITTGGRSSHSS